MRRNVFEVHDNEIENRNFDRVNFLEHHLKIKIWFQKFNFGNEKI